MSPTVTTKNSKKKRSHMATSAVCACPYQNIKSLVGEDFLTLGPESGKIWRLKKVQYLQKKYHCQWTLLLGKKPKWIFHNFGNLTTTCVSSRLTQTCGSNRMASSNSSWRLYIQGKVISIQAPQYRQYALVSDFLDLANLGIREEALLATNWIKDRPERLKLQNLALATKTGPAMSSLPKNMTADVRYAMNKCESLGSGKQLILHGHPSAIAQDFSPHMAVLRRHLLPIMHFQCCMILQGIIGRNFDIFAATSGSAAWVLLWKTRSRPIGVRVCPVAQFNFFSTAFDPRAWTMVENEG